jgi:hypothetical protein
LSKPLGACIAALAVFSAIAASARPVSVPFDFSRNEVAIEANINGEPVRLLLDTGVSPSVIDGARAKSLGLGVSLRLQVTCPAQARRNMRPRSRPRSGALKSPVTPLRPSKRWAPT